MDVTDAFTMRRPVALTQDRPTAPDDGRPSPGRANRSEVRATTDAFATALERETPVLLAAARSIVMDDAEAWDIVQSTFEIALRHADDLRDPSRLRAWLLRIETREALRLRRRLARVVRFDSRIAEIPARSIDTVEAIEIHTALRRLPLRMRAAVVLHHMAGLSVAETADAMGTSGNTVKTQLQTGLARLRKELGDG
jgi:RNA polymerase sigma factor (sigma-70 family)